MDIKQNYFDQIINYLAKIKMEEAERISWAASVIADRIAQDEIIYIWGPGAHSNIGAMEIFFRAGGLMHVSAILDEGTMLSNGALRSTAIERTPGYGRVVIEDNEIRDGDVLIIVNAFGMNCACLDAAYTAKQKGAKTIAVTSLTHSDNTPLSHPARHPSKENLYNVCDYYIDSKVPIGDAVVSLDGIDQNMGAVSTFCNAYILNCLIMEVADILAKRGYEVPIWKSNNCVGGDEWNRKFIDRFRGRIRYM